MRICFWHRDRAINQMYIADPTFGGYIQPMKTHNILSNM